MKEFNTFQRYFIEEFYDDYREGLISRRTFIRRLAFITGSMTSVAAAMALVGCQPAELPAATEPMPEPETPAAGGTVPSAPAPGPVPDAQSPLSVPEGDPDLITEEVTYASQDAEVMAYLARPAATGSINPAVLVCHENRGLTPHIRDVARRFAKEGYVALAPDLLSREGGTAALDRDAIPGLLSNAAPERHVADFQAGYDYLQGLEFVDGARIAMNGYCFGGGVTWRCATSIAGLKAAAPFYGPAPDLDQVPNIQAAIFAAYAELDERINASIPALEEALQAAGVTYEIKIYPGVNHAFHNDTGERYDETQALQAWRDMLGWFAAHV
ncbi:MAG: dienelactone hydrolase family protein [Chloroflexi bacterium]|nr:MAG: dienelactone hydrolase family protein [Chloroflexota bacterium]